MTIIPFAERLLVNTPHGYGFTYAVAFVGSENATWTVVLKKDGRILHYSSLQLRAAQNHTLEINLSDEKPPFPTDESKH